MKKFTILLAIGFIISNYSLAEKLSAFGGKDTTKTNNKSAKAGCMPATGSTYLDINNVRALIHTGGDMWWDLIGAAEYEVPKGSGKHSLFAGAIWLGGIDQNSQLRLAAQRFRQVGVDYWPGPLIVPGADMASTIPEICLEFDKHFVITKSEVAMFRDWFNADPETQAQEFPGYEIPDIILNWPAHGNVAGYDYYLAPFFDVNGDGYYNPYDDGDYPLYDLDGILPCGTPPAFQIPRLFGDQTLWWVFNDNGNIHTETGGSAIGVEIRAQAFAFSTNDEINNMTFYNYQIINRSTYTLSETYFGIWTDADLGSAWDDYLGCDVSRGLGYVYNGDEMDGTGAGQTYGAQPPAIGIDFFAGPYQDPDGIDNPSSYDENGNLTCDANVLNGNINGTNFGDGIIDNERWGMRRFMYFSCDFTPCGSPITANDFYNYLKGIWLDGTCMQYGGTGYLSGGPCCYFMFPGNSDSCGAGTNAIPQAEWSEITENNPPGERRFVQSAGPFTFLPGGVNDITFGVVWARALSGGPLASVNEMLYADDKAQAFFDNCFKLIEGPDAPELDIIELEKELIFNIWNKPVSNNYLEQYDEIDPLIICPLDSEGVATDCDKTYNFQGYQVFQLKDSLVSFEDIHNNDLARLVFQCDIHDEVSQIINYEWSEQLQASIPVEEVNGANEGIDHSFNITEDMFAISNTQLINCKKYYYLAIAYAHNDYFHYNQGDPTTWNGQKRPYLASNKGAEGDIKIYEAIPRCNTGVNSSYGDSPMITQVDGYGGGYNLLELTEETIDEIMSGPPWKAENITYKAGYGPITIKVIDPLNVPDGEYIIGFAPDSINIQDYNTKDLTNVGKAGYIYDTKWFITDITGETFDTIFSDTWISYNDEKLIPELGLSVTINQIPLVFMNTITWERPDVQNQPAVMKEALINNGFIDASMEFSDTTKPWLWGVPDGELFDEFNWIRSGTYYDNTLFNPNPRYDDYHDMESEEYRDWLDPTEIYENIITGYSIFVNDALNAGGIWAPYRLCANSYGGKTNNYGGRVLCSPAYDHVINDLPGLYNEELRYFRLASVDLVITSDKSKWTRALVIEMCENDKEDDPDFPGEVSDIIPLINSFSEANALRFDLRKAPSVDKDGNPDGSGTTGMGWFPGYAIDVETGERLNIMFGEDSKFIGENGRDMLWNPTEKIATDLYFATDGEEGEVLFGGKHYIYIIGNNIRKNILGSANWETFPAYDEGESIRIMLDSAANASDFVRRKLIRRVFRNAMWVSIPLHNPDYELLSTDVTIKLRVANPYYKNIINLTTEQYENLSQDEIDSLQYLEQYLEDIASPNYNYPMYVFNTSDYQIDKTTQSIIKFYPNPSNGLVYIEIQNNQKEKLSVEIYNIHGQFIYSKQFNVCSDRIVKQVDLSNYSKGIYFIKVGVNDIIKVGKIIIF